MGELVRVRVDFIHHSASSKDEQHRDSDEKNLAGDIALATPMRADLALPTTVPLTALLPGILEIFEVTPQPGRFVSWRFRNARGEVLSGESTLAETGIIDGDRLLLNDDPGPVPPPMVMDVADQLADSESTTTLADAIIGNSTAVITSSIIAITTLLLAASDSHLAAAIAFVLALATVAGLRMALLREATTSTLATLAIQTVVLCSASAAAFIGVPHSSLASDWRPIAAVAATMLLVGAALIMTPNFHDSESTSTNHSKNRSDSQSNSRSDGRSASRGAIPAGNLTARAEHMSILLTIGAATSAIGVLLGCYSMGLYLFEPAIVPAQALSGGINQMQVHGDIVLAHTVTIAIALLLLMAAPTLSVAIAGVRVPHIPAAGEAFSDTDLPSGHGAFAVLRSSRLIDGFYLGICLMLSLSGVISVVAPVRQSTFAEINPWTCALAIAVATVCAVQSRSHARLLPACSTATTTVLLLLAVATITWLSGWWPLTALIVIPLTAAAALQSLPSARVTPTLRRALEVIEATAIAVAMPVVAIVLKLPGLVAGLVN